MATLETSHWYAILLYYFASGLIKKKKQNTQFETADILLLEPTFPLVTVRCVRVTVAFGTQTHVTEVNR